jgi:hypothetical protein
MLGEGLSARHAIHTLFHLQSVLKSIPFPAHRVQKKEDSQNAG